MAIHSSILIWTVPWTEEPGGESDTTEQLTLSLQILQHYNSCGWLNLRMWNCGYGGLNVKLYTNF